MNDSDVSITFPQRLTMSMPPGWMEELQVTAWRKRRDTPLMVRTRGSFIVDCGHDQHRLDIDVKSWAVEVAEYVGRDRLSSSLIAEVHAEWAMDGFCCDCGRDPDMPGYGLVTSRVVLDQS